MFCRALLAAVVLLAAVPARAAAPPGVSVTRGWFALAPKTPVVGFFTITNKGGEPRLMTGWSSPGCHVVHMEEANGSGIGGGSGMTVAGKSTMAFVRGGYHLLCVGPTGAIRAGATVPVTISFANGFTLTAPFQIRDVDAHTATALRTEIRD
jgi:copper(I)-binding protein